MYHLSRSIYRELAPAVVRDSSDPTGVRGKRAVLESCETMIMRVAKEPHFARPVRALFQDVRFRFAATDQPWVLAVIEQHAGRWREELERLSEEDVVVARRCEGVSRNGTRCQRDPIEGRSYCPSHKHLEEPAELAQLGL